jgi:hypothetical protein
MRRANARTPSTRRQTSAPSEFLLDLDQRSNDLIDTELTFCAGRAQGRPMKDDQKHLEKLRADAAECVLISDQATNPEKQELFDARYRSPVRRPVPAACPVEAMMARSWSPTLFRKAFHIKGNNDLRGVSLTYALQVFQTTF